MRRLRWIGLALPALLMLANASGDDLQPPAAQGPPDWWEDHAQFMSADGGTWVTPNPPGEGDPDTPDAYGMRWTAGGEGRLLMGRLYGLEAGHEVAEYWTFREFWHPGERRVVVEQWSTWGAYGEGETTSSAPGRCQLDQTFWLPDGRSWREGHRAEEKGDLYLTQVFDIDAQGSWTLRVSNTWRRVKE